MLNKLSDSEVREVAGVWLLALKQLATEYGRHEWLKNGSSSAGQVEYHEERMVELMESARNYADNLFCGWNDTDRMQWDHYTQMSYSDMDRRYNG